MALTQVPNSMLAFDGGPLGMRNRIINGDMRIDQRNAGASVTLTSGAVYTLDRFSVFSSQASKLSCQQNAGSITPPTGFTKYLGVTSLSAYSITSTDQFCIQQAIEGFNISDLSWGTANAQSVTLSFRVYSSLTGTFGGVITNGAQNRSYPFTYSISSANTWTTISLTIAGDTSGTWATDNTAGMFIKWGLGVGSTYSGTAGSWQAAGLSSATGATSIVGTNGATFYITGVQLEVGSVATPFERRLYGQEVALCQRYFSKSYNLDVAPATITGVGGTGGCSVGTNYQSPVFLPVTMRVTPTGVAYNNATGATGTWRDSSAADRAVSVTNGASTLIFSCSTNGINAFYNGQWTASAEL